MNLEQEVADVIDSLEAGEPSVSDRGVWDLVVRCEAEFRLDLADALLEQAVFAGLIRIEEAA